MPRIEVLDDCECWKICICVHLIVVIWVAQKLLRLLDAVFNFVFRNYAKFPVSCALFSSVLFIGTPHQTFELALKLWLGIAPSMPANDGSFSR